MQTAPQLEAVVWDMDGLLLDTERIALQAFQIAADRLGYQLDPNLFQSLIGRNTAATLQTLALEMGSSEHAQELYELTGKLYDDMLADGPPLKAGAAECLEFLHQLQVPQALATSSSYRLASRKLEHHDLFRLFQTTVTGDQVQNGKPHPEPFLLAAQRLDLPPENCLAFEDSVNGIKSAKQAGMTTVLVPDICPHDEESLARVDYQFPSLLEARELLEKSFSKPNPN